MKTALILVISSAATVFASDPQLQPSKNPPTQPEVVKRLGTVTWDLENHKLVWTVQQGEMRGGEFVTEGVERYEISPDQALMAVADEERGFDGDEAVNLHHLLDVLSVYCAESVVWWDEGRGVPVQSAPRSKMGEDPKAKKPADPESKPVKVKEPEPRHKPTYHVPDGHMVAMVRPIW